MSPLRPPIRETAAAAAGLPLYPAVLWLDPAAPGPGALALCAAVGTLHGALLAPACDPRGGARWALLPLLLALPALAATSYGHPGAGPLLRALAFVALGCLAGTASRAARRKPGGGLYLPTVALLFALPPVLRYLALEFSGPAAAAPWDAIGPLSAADLAVRGDAPWPWIATLLLLAWPVAALARRGRPA